MLFADIDEKTVSTKFGEDILPYCIGFGLHLIKTHALPNPLSNLAKTVTYKILTTTQGAPGLHKQKTLTAYAGMQLFLQEMPWIPPAVVL